MLVTSWVIFVLCSVVNPSLEDVSPNMNPSHHCADLNPQPHVDIEQLMGMWYVIEIISHKQEARQIEDDLETCPIIYISEDRSSTTLRPLDKSYLPGQIYGSGFGTRYSENYGNSNPYYTEPSRNPPYELDTQRDKWPRYGTRNKQHRVRQKRLELLWVEGGSAIDFSVYYSNKLSVWLSSGPHNGSSLPPQLDQFAGIIQVIKAVGNHLVLTFCYRLPEPKLYTTLMSRLHKLDQIEINGVHNLLTRKGLELSVIRKTCSHNGWPKFSGNFPMILLALVVTLKIFGC